MRYFFVIFVFLLLIECSGLFASVIRKNINSGWRFSADNGETWRDISLNMDCDTCKWRNRNNSKWNVSEKKEIVGIYRREDVFTENDLKNEYIYLFLSGISEKGEIFANGHSVAAKDVITDEDRWLEPLYGNIRPYLHNGKNRIEIKITDREGKGVLYAPVKYVISDRELELGDFYPSAEELNPEFFNLMNQALRRKCPQMLDYLNGTEPFSLFWFTDVHGDGLVLERLMKFYNNNKFFFDDAIHTGDAVHMSFISDFTFWEKVSGTENVLQVMGNHENLKTHINYDWVSLNFIDQKTGYDKFFAPYIRNWGVNYT
ncbi:MAG: metallophosphoesterase, partial [Armatimonadetes bacterium]|nr:metallophosphoesterase [Candidatus Hippobium faecium]